MKNKAVVLSFFLPLCIKGQAVEYKYDSLYRLLEVKYPNRVLVKYTYDGNGNRRTVTTTSLKCLLNSKVFTADTSDSNIQSYQWEVNDGAGFIYVINNENYAGANTATLKLQNVPTAWYGYQYRCRITLNDSSVVYNPSVTLTFVLEWKGSVNDAWENPLNWSCGVIPDENTDVIIQTGVPRYPVVYSGGICRKLHSSEGTFVTVKDGKLLSIMGK